MHWDKSSLQGRNYLWCVCWGGGGLSPQCLKIAIVGEIYQIREELVGQEYVLIISNLMQVVISIMHVIGVSEFSKFCGDHTPRVSYYRHSIPCAFGRYPCITSYTLFYDNTLSALPPPKKKIYIYLHPSYAPAN